MPLSVVVLAAGQGKRMRSQLPKVLHQLAGRPLLAHVLATARALAADSIHIVFGHGGDEVRACFPEEDLSWWHQSEQLGTGHAVAQAAPALAAGDDVLVLCGDVPLIRAESLQPLLEAAAGSALALLTARVDDPTGYGRIVRDEAGHVVRIVEQKDASAAEQSIDEINTGIVAARGDRLAGWLERLDNDNSQGEYYLTDIVALAHADGVPVAAVPLDDASEAMGINDKVQLADAERRIQARAAAGLMERGVTLADPARVDVRGELEVGSDVYIDVGAIFEGHVRLGDGCRIGPYTIVRESRIGAGSVVHPYSSIDSADVGARCQIGPFARIRPATELADEVRIGNFVETKKSQIAAGSKVNHLSYIGDATIGAGVNVGAGTITCNYDGANKHRTTIGDGAFIGSGANLVAPVEVGAGATIAAGSTVTRNAPAGKLSIARSRQTTVEHWRRPAKKAD